MIGILDYGLGNVQALMNCYDRLGLRAIRVGSKNELDICTHFILPGVGSFDRAMIMFNDSGLREPVEVEVLKGNRPILGICVGMQMLADSSEEGSERGLSWIQGTVRHLSNMVVQDSLSLPHMGWNNVTLNQSNLGSKVLNDLDLHQRFYFLHSYFFETKNPADILATVDYGANFCCAVARGNIFGAQFHPEKSHQNGLVLLKNFAGVASA